MIKRYSILTDRINLFIISLKQEKKPSQIIKYKYCITFVRNIPMKSFYVSNTSAHVANKSVNNVMNRMTSLLLPVNISILRIENET